MVSFTLLCTTQDELLRTAISNADGVHSGKSVILTDHPDNSLCVGHSPISQQEYLLRVSFNQLGIDEAGERVVYFSSPKVCPHGLDPVDCTFDLFVTISHALRE